MSHVAMVASQGLSLERREREQQDNIMELAKEMAEDEEGT